MNRTTKNPLRLAAAATALAFVSAVAVATGSMSAASPDDDPTPPSTEPPTEMEALPTTVVGELVEPIEVQEEPPTETEASLTTVVGELVEPIEVQEEPPTETETSSTTVVGELVERIEVQEEVPESDTPSRTVAFVDGTLVHGEFGVGATVFDFGPSCSADGDCVAPTGYVEFYLDGEFQFSYLLREQDNGQSPRIGYAGAGPHDFEAVYLGGNLDASSDSLSFTAQKAECTATLTGPDSATSTAGDTVVFAADVTSNSELGIMSGGTLTMWLSTGEMLRELTPFDPPGDIEVNNLPAGSNRIYFDYSDDNHNLCSSGSLIHEVVAPSVVANDDVEVAYQDNPFGLGVLYNDENAESIVNVGTPSNGTAEVVWDEPNDSEIVKYTPNPGFVGQDTFTYTASNGAGHTDEATVTVDVRPFKAVDDDATTVEGVAIELAVFDNDTGYDEYTSIFVADAPAHGIVDLHPCSTLSSDSCVTDTPDAGFDGTDSFGYELSKSSYGDIHAKTSATVTVTVTPNASSPTTTTTTTTTNAPPAGGDPVAVEDSFEATADGVLLVGAPGVLANDLHPDGAPLTAQLAADAEHGTVVLNTDGSFAYSPDAGFVGNDSFSYVASDGGPLAFAPAGESRGIAPGAVSAPASVVITVNPATPTTTTSTTSSTTTMTTPTTPSGTLPATR